MTVSELISRLHEHDPTSNVFVAVTSILRPLVRVDQSEDVDDGTVDTVLTFALGSGIWIDGEEI